jgi:hypothetical protein
MSDGLEHTDVVGVSMMDRRNNRDSAVVVVNREDGSSDVDSRNNRDSRRSRNLSLSRHALSNSRRESIILGPTTEEGVIVIICRSLASHGTHQ